MSESRDALLDNDARLAVLARSITPAQWTEPSLCTEWTNHDVLAHLVVGYGIALSAVGVGMFKHRGSFDAANTDLAKTLAARRDPAQLVDEFTRLTRRPRGIGRIFPKRLLLGDHVVHELDITYALGMESAVPLSTVVGVLNTQVRVPNPFVPAAARARGLNLIATDANWSHRAGGLTVAGQAAHLASVLAGRPWALRHLSGDGVGRLASRV
ncbi:MAG: maleylpyruvate isomerase family mycothiol-dependent enzyme [Mycobacterium sp.]|uniref:maleylpyruvate isomerase family mycothiol-dependent enzyme n=1 Tax=Mycobacterium sp. TaxID=1785 RepID=UPI001EBFF5DD|nr:maleylpyruvate isomerase family mycothiol-dependent enzyme [Mycobacterium sp.]MBV8786937.1 maleylpyruvate isomerase family mycothiol-dependent enzyme [Mycobacterium sp.]